MPRPSLATIQWTLQCFPPDTKRPWRKDHPSQSGVEIKKSQSCTFIKPAHFQIVMLRSKENCTVQVSSLITVQVSSLITEQVSTYRLLRRKALNYVTVSFFNLEGRSSRTILYRIGLLSSYCQRGDIIENNQNCFEIHCLPLRISVVAKRWRGCPSIAVL